MQVAFLDFPHIDDRAIQMSFAQPQSLDAVDLLVWRPAAWLEVYAVERWHEGRPILSVVDSQRAFRDSRLWREAFLALLERGGTLVVLAPGFTTLGLHTVQDVVPHDPMEALPGHPDLRASPCAPAAVVCNAGQPFAGFFEAFGTHFVAESQFRPQRAQAIAHIAGTAQVCGTYQHHHPGRTLVLPALRAGTPTEVRQQLIAALVDMAGRLRFDGHVGSTYAWKQALELPEEAAALRELAQVASQRRALQDKEAALAKRLADLAFMRQLQSGDATGVIDAARQVLHALGAYTQHGISHADTLMFQLEETTGVLVAIDDAELAPGIDLPAELQARAAVWAAELNTEVAPIALYIGGNRRGVDETAAELTELRRRYPQISFISGAELQAAYAQRDTAFAARAARSQVPR